MKLDELLAGVEVDRVEEDPEVEISGLSHDSRKAAPGCLFFALASDPDRNRANINDALNRGASAVVMKGGGGRRTAHSTATIVECERPRQMMGVAASRFFSAPSERLDVIGVTGTSGKTTVTYLLASIFEAAKRHAGVIGTIGTFIGTREIAHGLTTPESLDIESALAQMIREGVSAAAVEVSSEGLDKGRVEELSFRAAVFTHLGRDHLNYHGTVENYFQAKLRLFNELLPRSRRRDKIAAVRGDDPYGHRILETLHAHAEIRALSYGTDRSFDAYPLSFAADLSGIHATISVLGKRIEFKSPLIGEFHLMNLLAASLVSVALGIEGDAVAEGLAKCSGAPGRMEAVKARDGVTVLVDYAHKPDALEAVLKTVARLCPGRVICVFGCGGDRDRGKRPIMGRLAAELSDLPIVTSDNPRSEEPLAIISEIEAGVRPAIGTRAREYKVEPDRRTAIGLALATAKPGDAIVIAGKGHEDYQLVGKRVLHFDDREVVRELAMERGAQP